MPTSVNSKNPKLVDPYSTAAFETSTLIGVPVSASMDPAWAPKTSGIRSFDVGMARRVAMTTTTGRSAATAPLTLTIAVRPATSSIIRMISRVRLVPARSMSC